MRTVLASRPGSHQPLEAAAASVLRIYNWSNYIAPKAHDLDRRARPASNVCD